MANEQSDFIVLIDQLDSDIAEIKRRSIEEGEDRTADIRGLEQERDRIIGLFFDQLTPWDKVRLARHPRRPYTLDLLNSAFDDFLELHGDRVFSDDPAMVTGLASISGYPVVVCGQQKGRDIKDRKLRNFGSARPDGYRKALRTMRLAEKFRKPIVAIVDTPAADCSVDSESRGISEAIARNLMEMFRIRTPIVVLVIGEGGSGGALGIAVGDRVLMLEHAVYSVIPPEGCAAILWRDPERKQEAADALKLTAADALGYGLIDRIVMEPFGGAHRDPEAAARLVREALVEALDELTQLDTEALLQQRYEKFRAMGRWYEPASGLETSPAAVNEETVRAPRPKRTSSAGGKTRSTRRSAS